MYGLPPDFDYANFIGREITRLAFTLTNVVISFEYGADINVRTDFSVSNELGVEFEQTLPPSSAESFHLLGPKIVQCLGYENGDLNFRLENGWSLHLRDNIGPYVAYEIHVAGTALDRAAIDPSIFIGKQIDSTSYGERFILPFGRTGNPRLEGDSRCLIVEDGETNPLRPMFDRLFKLAAKPVVAAAREGVAGLVLTFDDGKALHCVDDGTGPPPYQVFVGGMTVYV